MPKTGTQKNVKNGHDLHKTGTQKNAKKRARCAQNKNTKNAKNGLDVPKKTITMQRKTKKTDMMGSKQEHRKTQKNGSYVPKTRTQKNAKKTDMMGPKQEHRKTQKKRTLCAQNKPSEK